MSENQDKIHREIDLLDLLARFMNGLKRMFVFLFNGFIFLFVFGIRRIHWLLLFVLIGAGIGYINYKFAPRFYTSEMIAQPNGFTSIDMSVYINDLHEMCKKGNTEGISNALQLDQNIADNIKDIEAFLFIDLNRDGYGDLTDYKHKYDPKDTAMRIVYNRILIHAQVYNNAAFDEIKNGLFRYIDNNPYLVTVNKLRKQELQALIDQSNEEIRKLDSLQNYEYFVFPEQSQSTQEGQIVFMNEQPTQLYYRDKKSLLETQLQQRKSLELATVPVTVIKDFTQLQMEENPLTKYLIIFGVISGCFGFILLIIIRYWKLIISFLNRYR